MARKLKRMRIEEDLTFEAIINQLLRDGLELRKRGAAPQFRVEPKDFGFHPDIDPFRLNDLAAGSAGSDPRSRVPAR
ncbi:MAG: hypothetical protein K2X35_09655 [Bryobacteraceae bacterium]|nr:hypothetical protein [Bryobacteraceae bacterium]